MSNDAEDKPSDNESEKKATQDLIKEYSEKGKEEMQKPGNWEKTYETQQVYRGLRDEKGKQDSGKSGDDKSKDD